MPGVASAPEAVAVDGGIRGSGGIDDGVKRQSSLFDRKVLARATLDAVAKFDPRVQVRNPVMFVVLVGTVVTLVESVAHPSIFAWSVTIWLALTVLFANFAESIAEGRGKAAADALRAQRVDVKAKLLIDD